MLLGRTVNVATLVVVPPAVVTEMGPVLAPVGTVTAICVAESTVKLVAATPLNFTAVAPVKKSPLTVTEPPTRALVGEKEVTTGAGVVKVCSRLLTLGEPIPVTLS